MIATSQIEMHDLSRQRRITASLDDILSPEHTVGQAVEHYIERSNIPQRGERWTAFSRGRRLDMKTRLSELPEVDSSWDVLPEVSAGAR